MIEKPNVKVIQQEVHILELLKNDEWAQNNVLFILSEQIFIILVNLKLMLEKTPEQLDAWKTEMKVYEKNKRTKKPFGHNLPQKQYVTYEHVKREQTKFNPVLQKFRSPNDEALKDQSEEIRRAKSLITHLKQKQKYERKYDIVNLHTGEGESSAGYLDPPKNIKLGPIRNVYNVINNQRLPDFQIKNRQLRLPIEREKVLLANNQKQFDIVTGTFKENHEQKMRMEQNNEKSMVMEKYWKTHDFDPVFGKFYDTQKEQQFQASRKEEEKNHGKDHEKHLPPSYVYREPFIPDPTKQLPESLQTLDEKRMNAKKRYKMKYCVEDEYAQRNVEDDMKYENVIKNKIHNGRILDEKNKEFNIVTMKKYPDNRAERLYKKEIVNNTWDRLNTTGGNVSSKIKSAGFQG